MEDLASDLSADQHGVMIASQGPNPLLIDAVDKSQALQLLIDPVNLDQVSAALTRAAQLHGHMIDLAGQREKVRQQIADRMVVEQAKQVIMAAEGMSEPQAMRLLQEQSRRHNQKLVVTAQKILTAARKNGTG